jgi:7,8-dihydropterin-6-yl-methyl-4-(beta-D-ribofuranosyl)aminobenzene 5'-phosphate synthase
MLFGCCESGIGRRDILCSGGSAIFSSLIGALLGDAKLARAQTISGTVPEVDRATVRVVTDNYHFALSPSGKIGERRQAQLPRDARRLHTVLDEAS